MAPKTGKTKPHKAKGDKKKKEEKGLVIILFFVFVPMVTPWQHILKYLFLFFVFAVLPAVIEITVETPEDSQVTLKVCIHSIHINKTTFLTFYF